MEFIDGDTLREYIIKNQSFPLDISERIGEMLALIHRKKYDYSGKLNDKLEIYERFSSFSEQYIRLIGGMAGSHLKAEVREKLKEFIRENRLVMEKIEGQSVFCHGDFNFSNIMIDYNKDIWFIDFEYSIAYPPYYDIGKFFRTRTGLTKYMTEELKDSFKNGYNSCSDNKLDDDWYNLSKLSDIVGMLSLINIKEVPEIWISEIEDEIMETLDLFS